MGLPAVQLGPWFTGGDASPPEVGIDGFAALVPIDEPATVGEPPVVPSLVSGLSVGHSSRVVRVISGQRVSSAMEAASGGRSTMSVNWDGLTLAERQTLEEWIYGTLQGTLYGWDLRPDGPDSDVVKVRCLETPVTTNVTKNVWKITANVEEIW